MSISSFRVCEEQDERRIVSRGQLCHPLPVSMDTPLRHSIETNILPAMAQSPSSHNTQPWTFRVHADTLAISPDHRRRLPRSDPLDRQLYVSLGCAVANGIIAAAAAGYETQLSYAGGPPGLGGATIAHLTFTRGSGSADAFLAPAIARRSTNRALYEKRRLDGEERGLLRSLEHPDIVFIEERDAIREIAALTERGTAHQFSRRDFRKELSQWVRGNWTRELDGMPGYTLGIPGPLSVFAPPLLPFLPLHFSEAPKSRRQAEHASVIAVILTDDDSLRGFLEAGQVLERLWLQAAVAGLSAAPLTTLIEATNGVRDELRQFLHTERFPQAVLRIGSSRSVPRPSPRRPAHECMETT